MRGEIDFPKAALANQLAQRIVADTLEFRSRKLTNHVSMSCTCTSDRMDNSLKKLLVRVCELDVCQYACTCAALILSSTTHLLSLGLLFSGGPGIHEKRHLCVETGVFSPSSNTALDLTIGLSRVVVNAAQAKSWCVR